MLDAAVREHGQGEQRRAPIERARGIEMCGYFNARQRRGAGTTLRKRA
jgi:hypothetical protein